VLSLEVLAKNVFFFITKKTVQQLLRGDASAAERQGEEGLSGDPQASERISPVTTYLERHPSRLAACYTRNERKLLTHDFRDEAVRALCLEVCLGAHARQEHQGRRRKHSLTFLLFGNPYTHFNLKKKMKPCFRS